MPVGEIAKVAKVVALPDELQAFYERAGGASIGSVDVFTSDELRAANKRRSKALSRAVFFASDGADGFFFIDAGNSLQRGTSCIYWHERSTTVLARCLRRQHVQELADIVGKLRDGTVAERQKYAARSGHIIWRVLMPRTRNHVYYRANDAAGEIEVLLVWNAIAGSNPDV